LNDLNNQAKTKPNWGCSIQKSEKTLKKLYDSLLKFYFAY
jgi:hypothetical protein